ncbi:MAG TPA: membrane dipeptidase [Phycisphaerales bacterium]|nr:membrane dipeptidase [Phycisphaerales bacterium]
MLWFDAHLDLAYLAVNGRDLAQAVGPETGPHAPAAVSLPDLAAANVRLALATIFTEAGGSGPEGYPPEDAARARAAGRAQLEVYLTLRDRGLVALDLAGSLRAEPGLGELRGGLGVAEVVPAPLERRIGAWPRQPAIRLGILLENADPVASPGDLSWWVARGVVAVGMAWVRASRYAGGNGTALGLSTLGRELAREMDRLGVVHDLAHLSDRALADLLAETPARVIASHSNCRALLGDPENQRHLTDETIREVARRGGVVGLNLYSKFLRAARGGGGRARLDDCVRHIEHVCELAGHRRAVGLGSDMDGGLSAADLPEGINGPRGLMRLAEALERRGWSERDVEGFAWRNWAGFWAGR